MIFLLTTLFGVSCRDNIHSYTKYTYIYIYIYINKCCGLNPEDHHVFPQLSSGVDFLVREAIPTSSTLLVGGRRYVDMWMVLTKPIIG